MLMLMSLAVFLPVKLNKVPLPKELVFLMEYFPITVKQIKASTDQDPE